MSIYFCVAREEVLHSKKYCQTKVSLQSLAKMFSLRLSVLLVTGVFTEVSFFTQRIFIMSIVSSYSLLVYCVFDRSGFRNVFLRCQEQYSCNFICGYPYEFLRNPYLNCLSTLKGLGDDSDLMYSVGFDKIIVYYCACTFLSTH